MSNNLVKTIFESGPDDELSTIDVYGKAKSSGPIGRAQSKNKEASQLAGGGFGMEGIKDALDFLDSLNAQLSNAISGSMNALSNALSMLERLASRATSLLTSGPKALLANLKYIIARVMNAASRFKNAIRNIPKQLNDRINNSMRLQSDIFVFINGVRTRINNTAMDDISSIGQLINDIRGIRFGPDNNSAFSTQDDDALGAILGNIIGRASELGIDNAFSAITQNISDVDLLNNVTRIALDSVVNNGDIPQLMDIANSNAGPYILNIKPNILNLIVDNYKTPNQVEKKKKEKYSLLKLLELMDKIKPGWDKYNINDDSQHANILELQAGNEDFRKLLIDEAYTLPDERKPFVLAAFVPPMQTNAWLYRQFQQISLRSTKETIKINDGVTMVNTVSTALKQI